MTGVVSLAVTLPRPGSRAAIPRAPSTGEDSNSFFTHDTGPLGIITCICRTLNILVQKDRNRLQCDALREHFSRREDRKPGDDLSQAGTSGRWVLSENKGSHYPGSR